MIRSTLIPLCVVAVLAGPRALAQQEPPESEPQPSSDLSDLRQRGEGPEWTPAEVEAAPIGRVRRQELWLSPFGSAYYLLGYASPAVAVGYSARLFPRLSVAVEAAVVLGTDGVCVGAEPEVTTCRHFNGFWLSLGPELHGSRRPQSGFYLLPKLVVARYLFDFTEQSGTGAGGTGTSTEIARGSGTATEISLGLDLGYQFELGGGFFLAPQIGAQLGVCTRCGVGQVAAPLNAATAPWYPAMFSVNLNLLRIGWAY